MALGERFQGGGGRGIARFLAEHQDHDAGFDVLRDQRRGTGRLRVTCKGCGESVEYRAADAGELLTPEQLLGDGREMAPRSRAADAADPPPPAPRRRTSAAIPVAPLAPLPDPPAAEPRQRRPRVPSWLVVGGIALLVGGGLVMLTVGIIRDSDESPSTPVPTASTPPATSAPAALPQEPAQKQPQKVVGGHNARPALHTESFAGRFAIGVAPHWTAGEEGTAVAVTAPGSGVEINIYFEAGDRPLGQLADSARSFLRQRHPGGQIGAPQRQPLAHLQALRITDSYPGGTEVAIVLTSGGYTYLLLERVDNGVPGRVMEQADAELASFRPL